MHLSPDGEMSQARTRAHPTPTSGLHSRCWNVSAGWQTCMLASLIDANVWHNFLRRRRITHACVRLRSGSALTTHHGFFDTFALRDRITIGNTRSCWRKLDVRACTGGYSSIPWTWDPPCACRLRHDTRWPRSTYCRDTCIRVRLFRSCLWHRAA